MANVTDGFREFEFDLPEALLAALIKVFEGMTSAPLLEKFVSQIPESQGVYQLLMGDEIVYIGKTDAESGLQRRLSRHAWTIQHRKNLDPAKIKFKAIRVFVFAAMDLETQLIRYYGDKSAVWNGSGFGANDPGRERDTTTVKPEGFDALYPLDIDRIIDIAIEPNTAANVALSKIKAQVPYVFRIEGAKRGSRKAHPDLLGANIKKLIQKKSVRLILQEIFPLLPTGWQATELPGRIIIYKETRDYPYGKIIVQS